MSNELLGGQQTQVCILLLLEVLIKSFALVFSVLWGVLEVASYFMRGFSLP